MINITESVISPGDVIAKVRSNTSGCVVTYIGLIRDVSKGKRVISVHYEDLSGTAEKKLQEMAESASKKWTLNGIAIYHRTGDLPVGEINLVVAIASSHRREGFAACRYVIDQFKKRMPTTKTERYEDNSVSVRKSA